MVASLTQQAKRVDLAYRRWRNGLLLASALGLVGLWLSHERAALRNPAWISGYLLLGSIVFLTAFQLRKRLIVLPLGSLSSWMQAHIYVGLGAVGLFLWHLPPRLPNGWFELALAIVFVAVSASGVFGLYLTRSIPKVLASLPVQVRYEEIPRLKQQLAAEVRQLVLDSAQQTSVIAEFYTRHLMAFFERPRSWRYWLIPSMEQRKHWEREHAQLDRYLTPEQRDIRRTLSARLRYKDDLDFHQVKQSQLKGWLFAHIGLTYALWMLMTVHVVLVHTFRGS